MKRLITLLFVGLFLVSAINAQDEPVAINIVGDVKVASSGVIYSKGAMYSNISATGKNGHITNEGVLNLPKGIVFVSDDTTDGTLLNKGTVSFTGAEQSDVKVIKKYSIAKRYYSISLPFDVRVGDIKDITGNKIFDVDFYIKYYDGQSRADNGMPESGSDPNWKWIDADNPDVITQYPDYNNYILKAGVAYFIYPNEPMEIVFYANANISDIYATQDKSIGLTFFTKKKPDSQTTEKSFGWNFVGNKQTCNFKISEDPENCYITGDFGAAVHYYTYDTSHNVWFWKTADPNWDDILMSPYTGCFYQIGEDTTLGYLKEGRDFFEGDISFRNDKKQKAYTDIIELNLDKDGESKDLLRVISGENYSNDFVAGEDAIKMFTPILTNPDFYCVVNDNSVIYNKIPATQNEVPLGIRTGESGTYTIRLNTQYGYEGKNIILEDKELNVTQDLAVESYSFSAGKINTKDRFVLRFADNYTNIDNPESGNIIVYTENNTVYVRNIAEGDLVQIYSTGGSLVKSEVASNSEISIPLGYISGVYIVKITGSKSLVTKVVIK